jgi:Rap1a immunity proteins
MPMRLTNIQICAFVASFLFWIVAVPVAVKPTRTECIIGYDLDWSAVKDQTSVRNSTGDLTAASFNKNLAGLMFSHDGSQLFLQYKDQCDNKRQMTDELIHCWQSHGLDLPKMTLITAPIKISPSTIDIEGPEWSDSPIPPEHIINGRYPSVETAAGLFLDCNKSDDNSKSACVGYIEGVFEVATNNPIDGIISCVNKLRNSSTIVQLTLKWIAAHPENAQKPASTAIAEALAQAYPCTKPKSP